MNDTLITGETKCVRCGHGKAWHQGEGMACLYLWLRHMFCPCGRYIEDMEGGHSE